jgi:signal peptidase I
MDEKKSAAWRSEIWEIIKSSILALLIVVPIRLWIAQPFIVQGSSMEPNFKNGDYLIVDEISYRFEPPQREDVIIFRYPKNHSQFYIKRIIGLPGEIINNVKLADDEYYVLGDNRGASLDSRSWGPLKADLIIGRAILRLWPVASLGFL